MQSMKLNKCHIISSRDSHFFGNRVINVWNSLSDDTVTSPTVACFKHRIAQSNFVEIFGIRKLESLGYHVVLFVWSYV